MFITLYIGAYELWLLGAIVSSGDWLIDWNAFLRSLKPCRRNLSFSHMLCLHLPYHKMVHLQNGGVYQVCDFPRKAICSVSYLFSRGYFTSWQCWCGKSNVTEQCSITDRPCHWVRPSLNKPHCALWCSGTKLLLLTPLNQFDCWRQ